MIFNANDHARLARLFSGVPGHYEGGAWVEPAPYAGYRPDVQEAPNGDTRECTACAHPWSVVEDCRACKGTGRVPNVDAGKRYLHVAPKYNPPAWAVEYLARAHYEACRVAEALGVPDAYYPRVENGTLRVLEYPVGAGTAEHTDFNLFTALCYRSHPADLQRAGSLLKQKHHLDHVSEGLHIGEIGELVGLGPATPHRVPARPYAQQSIVYFALPANGAVLPGPDGTRHRPPYGPTVAEWLAERIARSRVYA